MSGVVEQKPARTWCSFTDEFKRDAVAMVLDDGNKIADVARRLGIGEGTFRPGRPGMGDRRAPRGPTSAEGRVERATDQTRRYSEQLWGLPCGSVTSDLWCREVRLEGCAPCRGRIPGSSGRTWSGSPATVSLVSGHGEVVGHHPAGGFALEFPVAGSITTPAQGGDRVRTRSLRRRRRQPNVDAEVAAVPWCSGSAPRRRPRTRCAPDADDGGRRGGVRRGRRSVPRTRTTSGSTAGPAHRRGGEPGRRVPGVPHRAPQRSTPES